MESIDGIRNRLSIGNAGELLALADAYRSGSKGVSTDKVMAFAYYLKAADSGSGKAMESVGDMYCVGEGCLRCAGAAREWYLKAAGRFASEADRRRVREKMGGIREPREVGGFAPLLSGVLRIVVLVSLFSAIAIGVVYAVPGLRERLYAWYQNISKINNANELNKQSADEKSYVINSVEFDSSFKAAEAGSANAMYDLGIMYAEGTGVAQSYSKAAEWWLKAAEAGVVDAMCNLALLYETGNLEIKKDLSAAFQWYSKAAEAGDADAMYNLGYYYERGLGTNENKLLAEMWYGKAAAAGSKQAERKLNAVRK